MKKLSLLEIEERLLNHIKSVLKKENKYASRNIFTEIKTTGIIRNINLEENISDNFGFGHSQDTFTLYLVLNYYGISYKGTIVDTYFGGSCCVCDPVERASANNEDEWYMEERIKSLKFNTFSKINNITKDITIKKEKLDVNSTIEFPVLK